MRKGMDGRSNIGNRYIYPTTISPHLRTRPMNLENKLVNPNQGLTNFCIGMHYWQPRVNRYMVP